MTEQTATYELTTRGRFRRLLEERDPAALQLASEALEHAAIRWQSEDSFTNVFCHYCGELQPGGYEPTHKPDCLHERAREMLPGDRAGYAGEGS